MLTIDIQGADDLVQAAADIRTITEDAAPTTFTVLANDTLDPDAGALNTITTGTVTASGPAAPPSIPPTSPSSWSAAPRSR